MYDEGPYRDPGPSGASGIALPRMTPAIKWLLLINAAVFVLQFLYTMASGDPGGFARATGLSLGALEGSPVLGLYRFVSYQFVHSSTDLMHILMNMLVLYFFGTMVEERLGPRSTVRLYLLGGVTGGLFWLAATAISGNTMVPVVGASGSAYCLLIYAAFLRPKAQVIFIIITLPLWVLAAFFGGLAVFNTLIDLRLSAHSSVAHSAHVGGAIFGAFWWRFRPAFAKLRVGVELRDRERRAERERKERVEIDRILAKVKEEGMPGLSKAERRTLERYSERMKR